MLYNELMLKNHIVIALFALTCGCTTLNTGVKSNEKLLIKIQDRPTSDSNSDSNSDLNSGLKFSFVAEAITIGRLVGSALINDLAKTYDVTYSCTGLSSNIVQLTPIRKIDKRIIFERDANERVASKLTFDIVPVIAKDSKIGYCQIQPRTLQFLMAKAKLTNFLSPILKANQVDVTIKITLEFPCSGMPGGLTQCTYAFVIPNAKIGSTIQLDEFLSPVFEVGSDGPMGMNVQVEENNHMAGWLQVLASWVK